MKRTEDGEVRPCPSSCSITAAFPATDSGVYWCESGRGETSKTVTISVTAGSVILDSPVLPVMEGHHVTLSCRPRVTMSSFDLAADFYKDGVFIGSSSTGNMTIRSVSPSDEGLYKCNVSGAGGSADSWLTVRAPPAGRDPPPPLPSVSALLCHLVVGAPYLLSTILLGLIYRDRARGKMVQSTCSIRQLQSLTFHRQRVEAETAGYVRSQGAKQEKKESSDRRKKRRVDSMSPSSFTGKVQHASDYFLALTTDGINFLLSDQEICDVINQCQDPTEAADVIAEQALQYGSEDNATIIVVPLGAWGKHQSSSVVYSISRNFCSSGRWA